MSVWARRMTGAALVGGALVLGSLAPAGATASAGSAVPGARAAAGVERLSLRLASDPGQAANVWEASQADHAPVKQWPWGGGEGNELWEARDSGAGHYRFASVGSGKCLNVRNGGNEDNARIIQYTCSTDYDNDQWRLVRKGNGYQVVAKSSGKCLNVRGGTGEGNELVQYTCSADGEDNEVWLPVWEPAP
ncbi:RICIN domain-containing protein [Streptomyces albipurpureus]|uniref:RICIN domain-containing protein n=1 Tax=Streptomyces albipurpureus TaxID=2897419 RepID=A0ABT0UHZ2_9ACTN|nr:RICIN domain-containing protein [Streptomyces sp. CWNU-1]MCM2388282.1 RICIN domain-containing protein [Streptomyces sp. CWNU-1]